jgi:hypothetical protein
LVNLSPERIPHPRGIVVFANEGVCARPHPLPGEH